MLKPISTEKVFEMILKGDTKKLFFRKNELNTNGKVPHSFNRVDNYQLDLSNLKNLKFYIFEETEEE